MPATLVTEAPVGAALTQGLPGAISNQGLPGAINGINANASVFPHNGGITFPTGATSVGFEVATSYVPLTTFVDVVGDWADQGSGVITNGRTGHVWLAMVPPDSPPALPIPTLGDFKITGLNPVTGGQSSIGQIDVSGITSAGGSTIMLSSSHPAIASLPPSFFMPASTVLGQQVSITTHPPAVAPPVTLTATDGHYTFSAILTVLPAPPPPVLAEVSVNPTSVVGGNAATDTVTLSAVAPSGGMEVSLSDSSTAAAVPTSVTVAAGATNATFTVTTTSVTASTSATISAVFAGLTRTALLTVEPASGGTLPAPTLVSPAADARFSPGQAITFDWADVLGAASYTIQIDDSDTFSTPLIIGQSVTASQYANGTLPTRRLWWRARGHDAAGNPGAWSAVRRLEIK